MLEEVCGVPWQDRSSRPIYRYNAPDDNAYIERVIRTVKEEEIWPNVYDTTSEANSAIEAYVNYYNAERIHSALDYRTPNEVASVFDALAAA